MSDLHEAYVAIFGDLPPQAVLDSRIDKHFYDNGGLCFRTFDEIEQRERAKQRLPEDIQ